MKIFVMDIIMPPGIDGSIVHRWELVRNLSELGHEIHTLSYEEHKNIKLSKVHFHIIPKLKKQNSFGRLLYRFIYAIFLFKLIKRYHFDILYTRTPGQMSGIIGYVAKKILGSNLVFEINGIAFEEKALIKNDTMSKRKALENIKTKFSKYKEIFMWRKADAVIAVTSGIKRYLIQHGVGETKIGVIGNGANTELFKPMDQGIVRSELELSQVNKYVCFVGNLAPWQGVEYLIQAAPSVIESISETKFLIVGDGVMREQLEKMVENLGLGDDFIFTGNVSYEDVPKYINASNACVAPFIRARNEKIGLSPLKLYEYLACGKPVVGSSIEGIRDFLEDSNTGISFISEDHIELAEAIKKILIDKKIIEKMGKNGRQTVVEKYSWRKVAERVENICNEVIRLKREHENE